MRKLNGMLYGLACGAGLLLAEGAYAQEATLVRVTGDQYERTIHYIFGSTIEMVANQGQPGFREEGLLAVGDRKLTIPSSELERYDRLARQIAEQVVAEPGRRDMLIQCRPANEDKPDAACARGFVERVGPLLFRRPLADSEVNDLVAVHNQAATQLQSFNAGMTMLLSRMLVDPEFLFRVERSNRDPNDPTVLHLDAFSRAARLSYFLWDAAPDTELIEAAASGELETDQGLSRQVERMIASPRMEDGVRTFFADMLAFDGYETLSIDTKLYPKFTNSAESESREQTLRTIVYHLLNKDGDYRDLLTTRETFLTPSLAALYGVPLPRQQELGGAVPWVHYKFAEHDPYVGILSHASFVSLHSHPARTSPTLRGKALREHLLCQKVPLPTGDIAFELPDNPRFKTVRQQLNAHSSEPMCAGCHKITDPMGLSFEQFDTAGGFRTMENGEPIDATGSLAGKNFDGVAELAAIVRDDPALTSCVINRTFAFGTARNPTANDRQWLSALHREMTEHGVTWRELVRRIATHPDFYTVIRTEETLQAAVTQ
jgi:hypothetical protein